MSFPAYNDREYIFDHYRCSFEKRVHPDDQYETDPRYQYRKIQYLTYHADLDAYSAINDMAIAVLDTVVIAGASSPIVHVGNTQTNARLARLTFPGSWEIQDVSIRDGGDGSAFVEFSVVKEGTWTIP